MNVGTTGEMTVKQAALNSLPGANVCVFVPYWLGDLILQQFCYVNIWLKRMVGSSVVLLIQISVWEKICTLC